MSDTESTQPSQPFKKMIKDYIAIANELDEHNKLAKTMRQQKKTFEELIQSHMIENEIARLDLECGSIRVSRSKVTKRLGKNDVLKVLLIELDSEGKSEEIVETMFPEEKEVIKLEYKNK